MKVALVLLTVILVAAPSAAAKGVASAEVCGAGGCRDLIAHGAVELDNLIPFGASVAAPRDRPFYRLRLTFRGPPPSLLGDPAEEPAAQVSDVTYVPAARAARVGRAWFGLARPSLAAFRRATAGLEPLRAAGATGGPAEGGGAEGWSAKPAPVAATPAAALAVLVLVGGALLARRRRR